MLRPDGDVADAFSRTRASFNSRLQSKAVAYADSPQIVLGSFQAGMPDDDVLAVLRDWASDIRPLHVALRHVTVRSSDRLAVISVRQTLELFDAQAVLIELQDKHDSNTAESRGESNPALYIPVLDGHDLDDSSWARVTRLAMCLAMPTACCVADRIDVLRLDGAVETRLATIRLTP